jgi:hypothetical protein
MDLPSDVVRMVADCLPRCGDAALTSRQMYDAVRGGVGGRGAPTVRFDGARVLVRSRVLRLDREVDGWSWLPCRESRDAWRTAIEMLVRGRRGAELDVQVPAQLSGRPSAVQLMLRAATHVDAIERLTVRSPFLVWGVADALARLPHTRIRHLRLVGVVWVCEPQCAASDRRRVERLGSALDSLRLL